MTSRQDTKKIDIIQDAYLNIVIFFWNHIDDIEPLGEKAKEYFDTYHDSFKEVEARFKDGDFKSEADRDAVADELEQLYYAIVDIDPSSPVLRIVNPVIGMIENDESDLKCLH
jgi:hypothetical protein